jgi:glycerophosphoryl diester phosphodiesterase
MIRMRSAWAGASGGACDASAALQRTRRPFGVYPETKHPTCTSTAGLGFEDGPDRCCRNAGREARVLKDGANAAVFHPESFEVGNLQRLAQAFAKVPDRAVTSRRRCATVWTASLRSDSADAMRILTVRAGGRLAEHCRRATRVRFGPSKSLVIPRDCERGAGVAVRHSCADAPIAAGLGVLPWTFRCREQLSATEHGALRRTPNGEINWGCSRTELNAAPGQERWVLQYDHPGIARVIVKPSR